MPAFRAHVWKLFVLATLLACNLLRQPEAEFPEGVIPDEQALAELAKLPTPSLGSGAPNPVFGALALVPGGSRSMSSADSIEAVASSGSRYMRVNLDWVDSEPEPGQFTFDGPNDRKIQAIEAAGLRLFPTIQVGRGWMNGNPPSFLLGGSQSFPPDDLGRVWNDEYGYSRGYYNFLFQLFSHYRGHFDYVAIENEVNSDIFWGGTAEEYVRLMQTAYKAIKDADPDVTVVDSGFVSIAWGLCLADDYLKSGRKSRDEVVRFAIAFNSAPTNEIRVRSGAELDAILARPMVQEQCRQINYVLDNIGGSVDAINFHSYEDYRAVHFVVDWIRLRTGLAGFSPRIVTNEIGQRGPDLAYAEGEEHAKAMFKKMITSLALGLDAVVWFSADSIGSLLAPSPDKVGLFGDGGVLRPAGETFKLVSETIGTEYRFETAAAAGPTLYHYVFVDGEGVPSLEALWSENGGQRLILTAPEGHTQARITDYAGRTQTLDAGNGSIILTLSDAPVFVAWR